jgi:hypothetical protein
MYTTPLIVRNKDKFCIFQTSCNTFNCEQINYNINVEENINIFINTTSKKCNITPSALLDFSQKEKNYQIPFADGDLLLKIKEEIENKNNLFTLKINNRIEEQKIPFNFSTIFKSTFSKDTSEFFTIRKIENILILEIIFPNHSFCNICFKELKQKDDGEDYTAKIDLNYNNEIVVKNKECLIDVEEAIKL